MLVAGGWSLLFLAVFYYVVDILKWQRWCQPFVWIGMNAITLYVGNSVIGFGSAAYRLAGGDVQRFFASTVNRDFGHFVVMSVQVMLIMWFARFLYARKIFLRV